MFLKRLVQFYKPSSKKYSNTPAKLDHYFINIYTVVACDLIDILIDVNNNDGVKLLMEFLEDLNTQFEQIITSKSIHECLFSPQRLMNSLSQDYFVLIGQLSNNDMGLSLLQKSNILQKLHYIATNINVDCYVKLIVSSLSYVFSDETRKLLSSVLSCSYTSSKLYATKFLQVLLRTSASKHKCFRDWLIEMLISQLYDENRTISSIALNTLNEAVDNKNYLEILVKLRPSLLHLGDKGLLLLIRFLSIEEGFSYLQVANFVTPQLQRWATSFNFKYTRIIEGELHEAMSQYQKGDDGRFKKRITGSKMVLKDVIVPPHLYGQLSQHTHGFNILIKHENFHKMIQLILAGNCDSDETILDLKSALWAMGHVSTSSAGVKYLADLGIIKAIIFLAEKCCVYSVKATAFYVLSMTATTKEGVSTLKKNSWNCLVDNNHSLSPNSRACFLPEKIFDDIVSDFSSSPVNLGFSQNNLKYFLDEKKEVGSQYKFLNKFGLKKKSTTLPQRESLYGQIQHSRSYSESNADATDNWSSSGSPSCNTAKCLTDLRYTVDQIKFYSNSNASQISYNDSVQEKPSNCSEQVPTLNSVSNANTLIPSTISANEKEYSSLSFKPRSNINFGCRLTTQNTLGYKALRLLQNKHQLPSPGFSASATMEYLSAHDRQQMSPLIRPKFFRNTSNSLTHDFEIRESCFNIDDSKITDVYSTTLESSQFSHSTTIEEDKAESQKTWYPGICLPLRTRIFLSSKYQSDNLVKQLPEFNEYDNNQDENTFNNSDLKDSNYEKMNKIPIDPINTTYRKRRHDKSTCLLCSLRNNSKNEHTIITRGRKASSSSTHRARTETESSHGGTIDVESPIILTLHQKVISLIDTTLDGASSGTLGTSDSHNALLIPSNDDSSLKSRSILRKEVLKLIEQLGNPVLYKTSKQGLLHLKQICGDLFQDVCLFSDVCSLLSSINYRLQARQFIQDLFLEAPFYELYEDAANILNKNNFSGCENINNTIESNSSFCNDKPEKMKLNVSISKNLSVTVKNSRMDCNNRFVFTDICNVNTNCEKYSDNIFIKNDLLSRNLYNQSYIDSEIKKHQNKVKCRRAYSYPVTNYIITSKNNKSDEQINSNITTNFISNCSDPRFIMIPNVRSKSVSATCSYISKISLQSFSLPSSVKVDDLVSVNLADCKFKNNIVNIFSRHSLISLTDRPLLLTIKNPFDFINLDLKAHVLIENNQSTNLNDNSAVVKKNHGNRNEIVIRNAANNIRRNRKIAAFKSPDQNLLLNQKSNT